eukprot:457776-Alexandrium_andersonii.AAC.1
MVPTHAVPMGASPSWKEIRRGPFLLRSPRSVRLRGPNPVRNDSEGRRGHPEGKTAVSYTHLTLPTICSV